MSRMIHPPDPGHTTDQQFEALFNHATMGIIIVDHSSNIVLANDFACRQFGYDKNELAGYPIEQLIPARFHQKHIHHRNNFQSHLHNRPMGVGLDLYAIRKDGSEFPVEISLGHYEIDGKTYVMAFVSDITVRKEQEHAIQQLNLDLEKKVTERTRSLNEALEREKELGELKSRFVSMASHEFRTPLSTILSSVYLVSRYGSADDQPKREKHIDRIVSSVNMLSDILNDFLSLGKIEEGKIQVRWKTFDLPAYMASVVEETRGILKTGQELSYIHDGDQGVYLDPSLLKHIVMNLLSNAVKFSSPGSLIEVSTDVEPEQITCRVRDHGMGIPPDDMAHLFERFFRAANVSAIQGTGLGLHIVAKYAELMNGRIACSSELEKGTEFTVLFKKTPYEKDPAD